MKNGKDITDIKSILQALGDKRCRKVFSLKAAWFIKIISEYQKREDQVQVSNNTIDTTETLSTNSKGRTYKNKEFDKLDG